MKFCSKCGNQLFDEAVICPKCGCPTETVPQKNKSLAKINTGTILNNIAFIFNIIISGFIIYTLFFDKTEYTKHQADISITVIGPTENSGAPNLILFWVWIVLFVLTFIIGLLIKAKKDLPIAKMLSYTYLISSIISVIIMNIAFPSLAALLICVIGVVFFVPTILQVIATICFLQGLK